MGSSFELPNDFIMILIHLSIWCDSTACGWFSLVDSVNKIIQRVSILLFAAICGRYNVEEGAAALARGSPTLPVGLRLHLMC